MQAIRYRNGFEPVRAGWTELEACEGFGVLEGGGRVGVGVGECYMMNPRKGMILHIFTAAVMMLCWGW